MVKQRGSDQPNTTTHWCVCGKSAAPSDRCSLERRASRKCGGLFGVQQRGVRMIESIERVDEVHRMRYALYRQVACSCAGAIHRSASGMIICSGAVSQARRTAVLELIDAARQLRSAVAGRDEPLELLLSPSYRHPMKVGLTDTPTPAGTNGRPTNCVAGTRGPSSPLTCVGEWQHGTADSYGTSHYRIAPT